MSYSLRQNPAHTNNYTPGRLGNKVDKIVIHHAATTDFDGIGRTFRNPSREASAHYGVGKKGNVDQYVKESDIAWHAGNWPANCTSVGIENVNDTGAPNWSIADETFETLVELVRDIAKRHGLLPLKVGSTLFGHRDFSQTACPGQLYERLHELADKVNNGKSTGTVKKPRLSGRATDQVLEIGSHVTFPGTYRVDDLQLVYGIWQVRTKELCPIDFTWHDNAVPVLPLVEVDHKGHRTKDQVLSVASRYKFPGKYTVLNLAPYKGRWLAQINVGGWRLWVDAAPLKEVA